METKMRKILPVLVAAMFLAGCATSSPISFSNPFKTEAAKPKAKTKATPKAKAASSSWFPAWTEIQWPTVNTKQSFFK